jgi:hypothetical protein
VGTLQITGQSTAFGPAKFGDVPAGNYSEFENDGTLVFIGDAAVWDDLRVPLVTGRVAGANVPSFEVLTGNTQAWNFDDGDEIFFTVQMPHSWKIGSTIYPHLHWCPESSVDPSDNVGIGFEYEWVGIGDTFSGTITITRDVPTGVGSALKHLVHNFDEAGIDGSSITGVSSMLNCRFFRQAAGSDNYAGGIFALEVDFHYEIDTIGSRGIISK